MEDEGLPSFRIVVRVFVEDLVIVDFEAVLPADSVQNQINGETGGALGAVAAEQKRSSGELRLLVPATYPLHASLVADVTGILVQQARDSLARTDDLLLAALGCVPDRSTSDLKKLAAALKEPLINQTKSHAAIISSEDARNFGLPVEIADPTGDHWQSIWRLWTKYAILNAARVYEGRTASFVIPAN